MSDEAEDKPSALHPALRAVLERDGVSIPILAELLGLDRRTLREWGRQGEEAEARRAAYRTLDDLIAGRARCVDSEQGAGERWCVEQFGEGVPRAMMAKLASALTGARALLSDIEAEVARMTLGILPEGQSNRGLTKKYEESSLARLPEDDGRAYLRPMNAQVLQSAAAQVRQRARGHLVPFIQKVPPDFKERLEAAAKRVGLSSADYLRALIEVNTEPVEQ